ncbi:MAG: type II toxin-antitoxin system VapC family toxin [Pseudomonadota bacterium]
MIVVLDACAMIAFLRDEPGAATVEQYLKNGESECLAHAINLCEVLYDFIRTAGEQNAHQAIQDLLADGVQCRSDMDTEFWQVAAHLKATHRRISLADCFAVALANRVDAQLLTTDHHEFDPLVEKNICRFEFIR